jgi:hypothetical protein
MQTAILSLTVGSKKTSWFPNKKEILLPVYLSIGDVWPWKIQGYWAIMTYKMIKRLNVSPETFRDGRNFFKNQEFA